MTIQVFGRRPGGPSCLSSQILHLDSDNCCIANAENYAACPHQEPPGPEETRPGRAVPSGESSALQSAICSCKAAPSSLLPSGDSAAHTGRSSPPRGSEAGGPGAADPGVWTGLHFWEVSGWTREKDKDIYKDKIRGVPKALWDDGQASDPTVGCVVKKASAAGTCPSQCPSATATHPCAHKAPTAFQ